MVQKKTKRISIFGARLTSIISVALVLLLLGSAGMAGMVAKSLNDEVRRNFGFVVKMSRESTSEDIANLSKSLEIPAISEYKYMSSDSILAQEKLYIGEDVADMLDENPYNAEFEVTVSSKYTSPDSIDVLIQRFVKAKGVENVLSENTVIEGIDSTLRRVGWGLLMASAILFVVSVVLINNTVSLSVYSRRFVIHTMKLVGATRGFIRKPFIVASILNGLSAGCVASAFLIIIRIYFQTFDPLVESILIWTSMAIICILVIITGIVMCMLTAYFAANRYLNASYDDMYLK